MNVPDWLRSLVEPAHSAKRAEESRRMRLRHDLTKLIEQLNDLDRDLRTRFSCNRNETDLGILKLSSMRTVVLRKISAIQEELKPRPDKFSEPESFSN